MSVAAALSGFQTWVSLALIDTSLLYSQPWRAAALVMFTTSKAGLLERKLDAKLRGKWNANGGTRPEKISQRTGGAGAQCWGWGVLANATKPASWDTAGGSG